MKYFVICTGKKVTVEAGSSPAVFAWFEMYETSAKVLAIKRSSKRMIKREHFDAFINHVNSMRGLREWPCCGIIGLSQ